MAFSFQRRAAASRIVSRCAVIFALAALTPPAAGADIEVTLDHATLVKMPDRIGTVVVGNPLIADASVQAGGVLVVTGKGYGVTNIIALDRSGTVLLEKLVEVKGPRDSVVVVYRGVERESYSCTPLCERRIMLGDSNAYFNGVITQTGILNMQVRSNAVGQ